MAAGDYSYFKGLDIPWEKLRDKDVLVTGANGLIASCLVDALLQVSSELGLETRVHALCRNRERARTRFASHFGDYSFRLLIQDAMNPLNSDVEFAYIIHAASAANPTAFNSVPADVMRTNFLGTMNLLDHARTHGNGRVLFVSSSEVYGENEAGEEFFDESNNGSVNFARYRACYPESKRASETLCLSYERQYGSDVVIVRPSYIFGREIIDSNNRADVEFLRQVLSGEDIVMYSKGVQVRSYLYVKDCVSGMLYALLKGESGGIYNVGDERDVVTLWDYAQKLADAGDVRLVYDPSYEPEGKVFLNTTKCVLDSTRLRALGWKPRFTLDEGVADLFETQ